MPKYFKLYEAMWNNSVHTYVVKGGKKDLYAFIGYRYSTSFERIERISYQEVKNMESISEYYEIDESGNVHRYEGKTEIGLIEALESCVEKGNFMWQSNPNPEIWIKLPASVSEDLLKCNGICDMALAENVFFHLENIGGDVSWEIEEITSGRILDKLSRDGSEELSKRIDRFVMTQFISKPVDLTTTDWAFYITNTCGLSDKEREDIREDLDNGRAGAVFDAYGEKMGRSVGELFCKMFNLEEREEISMEI